MTAKKSGAKRKAPRKTTSEKVATDLVKEVDALPSDVDVQRMEVTAQKQIKAYRETIERQAEQIDQLQSKRYEIPSQSKPAKLTKKSWIRVIIPDTHGCFIDWSVANVMLRDLEVLKPREIVHMGDAIDCAGFLSKHQPFAVSEAGYTYAEDCEAANHFFDEVQKRAPKCEIHYLEGNHEQRIAKHCVNQTIRNAVDAQLMLDRIGPKAMLNLDSRGIKYYSRAERSGNSPIVGAVKLGDAWFVHGTKHGKNAPQKMLEAFGTNVIMGHIHKLAATTTSTVRTGPIIAWAAGCLCQKYPLWRHGDPDDWSHGYLFQVCHPDGRFWTSPVPILNNESLLPHIFKTFA